MFLPDRTIRSCGALLLMIGLLGLPSCTSQSIDAPEVSRPAPPPARKTTVRPRIATARLAKAFHKRINEERRRRGQPTFRWDAALGRIAGRHSRDMAKRNYFSHTSPDGKGMTHRYLKEHYACGVTINGVLRNGAEVIYRFSAESVQEGQVGDAIIGSAIEAWTAHDEDRRTLLSPHWQREGAGIFVTPDGVVYVTVNFC